jgi:RNA polymerase sigma-70 factor (ECF subfamily)
MSNGPHDKSETSGHSTSHSLLADARLADPVAWERLVRLYAPLVASWCRRQGVEGQDVVDVMQDVFSAVSGHLGRFRKDRPGDTFRGWLATITRNKIRDHFRKRLAEPAAAGGSDSVRRLQQIEARDIDSADVLSVDEVQLDDLLRAALDSIRGEFHDQTWQAFWKVVVEGRATADVAADLGMKPGTVRVAKSRVLLRLRRELGDTN